MHGGSPGPVSPRDMATPSRESTTFYIMSFRALTVALLLGATALTAQAQPALFSPSAAKQSDLTARQAEILQILRDEPGTAEIQIVVADAALLDRAASVRVELPDGREVTLATDDRTRRQPADFTWKGADVRATGPTSASASIVVRGGWLTGTIRADDAVYTLRPLTGGLHVIARKDTRGYRDHDDDYEAFVERNRWQEAESAPADASKGATPADIVIAYTSEVAAAYADPVAFAQAAVDSANDSFTTMGMTVSLNLAYAFQTSTTSSASLDTDLGALATTGDGRFDDATTFRDAYGADLVSLLSASSGNYGACGIGYLNASASTTATVTAYDCAIGNLSFAHEVGHNYGARHDLFVDASTTPYAYGHGYSNLNGRWRTIMAYNNECSASGFSCTRVAYWSDPDVNYPDATAPIEVGPTGTAADEDNARVLDERAATVAGYRTGGLPPDVSIWPGSLGAELAVGGTTTESITIQNVASSGALPVSWSASLQNATGPTLAPTSRQSPSGKVPQSRVEAVPLAALVQPEAPALADKLADCTDGTQQSSNSGSTVLSLASGATEYGQSFTAACTGRLQKINFVVDSNTAPSESWTASIRIYEGAGTSGTQLHASGVSWTNAASGVVFLGVTLSSPVDLTGGQVYTWFIDFTSGSSATWVNPANPDAGGTLYTTADGNPASATAVSGSDARYILDYLAPLTPTISWVSISGSTSGSVNAESSTNVDVAFDATGLSTGTYTADLVFTTNDPDAATVTVPVALVVNPAAGTVALDGSMGWRLLSVPSAATVDDLADLNLVAGVPGYYPTFSMPTLYTTFDGSAWSASTGTGEVLAPGKGFMWYFYDTAYTPVEPTTFASSSEALPVVLTPPNTVTNGDVDVTLHAAGTRFNALGNPFASTLPLTDLSSWTGGAAIGSRGRAYTYDPETASWAYPATSVEPWQGFVVRTKRGTGGQTLTIPEGALLLTGADASTEASKVVGPMLAFELEGTEAASGRVLQDRALAVAFEADAEAGEDDLDMEKLAPMSPAYVSLGIRAGDVLRAFESRPMDAASFEVPLVLQTAGAEMDMTLRWTGALDLPEGWRVTLRDLRTGDVLDLREATEYAFSAPPAPSVALGSRVTPLQTQLSTSSARFILSVDTGREPTAEEAVTLARVAPNPVRDAATLSWRLEHSETVLLEVVDLLGRVVQTVHDGRAQAGVHTARVNAQDLASGVYVVRLRAGDETRIQRLTVVR